MPRSVVSRPAEALAIDAFLSSLSGEPVALVLEGDPGIGKTTLWLTAVQQARDRCFQGWTASGGAAIETLSQPPDIRRAATWST